MVPSIACKHITETKNFDKAGNLCFRLTTADGINIVVSQCDLVRRNDRQMEKMEPMTLGSAPSSPASPGINPNFLPGFLMGGDNQPSTPNPNISPGRTRTSSGFAKTGSNSGEPRSLRQRLFNQSITESPGPSSTFTAVPEKVGPPKMGLFDTIEEKKTANPMLSSTVAHKNDTLGFNESISRIHDESVNYSRNVSNLNETLNRTGNFSSRVDRIDSHWVTVFGFPPSALTLVLSQLANCGPIADKKVPTQGNWLHVKFNNLSEVSKALALNGKLLCNNIMIGVQPYYNKENKENDSMVYTSPIRARSLRHSFISPHSPNTVVPPQTVPQKSTGIVTKAMEYVFGW
ncbi:hypothetical protein NQ317_001479 [Molorchus minor]|uniref:Nucleoporin NUP53 n=1 Tax=Molorchus minor TaxID=1323400 RepID=A0ABQ9JXP1_9CUCU|nr:hypothetical protein NQ317_001479 [Molorchus minor]